MLLTADGCQVKVAGVVVRGNGVSCCDGGVEGGRGGRAVVVAGYV